MFCMPKTPCNLHRLDWANKEIDLTLSTYFVDPVCSSWQSSLNNVRLTLLICSLKTLIRRERKCADTIGRMLLVHCAGYFKCTNINVFLK